MDDIDVNDTTYGEKLLEKRTKRFRVAHIKAYKELNKLAERGRKDVACKVALNAVNVLIDVAKKGYPQSYWAKLRMDKGVQKEQKNLFKRLKKAEASIEDMLTTLAEIYESGLREKVNNISLYAAKEFLYQAMGWV